ncbi:hypothetical protein O1611_g1198 [Lasiodiplodia mahajangana]|uniref:Uncharacterized protein n=1 Tax=Lasiodiplodia mahajangana TaxID=1108764 RepID=A0ACC2JY41_9PEZI|nr:hypothetical protein O1611_g1198 [Lasiodiplodia mahajangana]
MGISDLLTRPQDRAYFAVAVFFQLTSVVALVLRFLATERAGRRPHVEDWLAFASLLLYLCFSTANLAGVIRSEGRPASEPAASEAELAVVGKLVYVSVFVYFYQQFFAKLSILALYYRLFKVNPKFKRGIDALVAYHAIWITVSTFLISFICRPLAKFWDSRVAGQCTPIGPLIAVTETLNSVGDFLLVGLAITIVGMVQISEAAKRKLFICFGLGALAGVVGFIKIGFSFLGDAVREYSGSAALP